MLIRQEGNYHIKDEDEQIIETGKARATIKMYPSSKSKKKKAHLESRGGQSFRRMEMGDDSQSYSDEAVGGYNPAVRRILAEAERR